MSASTETNRRAGEPVSTPAAGDAVLFLTSSRRILCANEAAGRILGIADALCAVDGRLVALKAEDDRRLEQALVELLEGDAVPGGVSCVGLPLARRSGRPDYLLVMCRGRTLPARRPRAGDVEPEPQFVVVIHDFDARPPMPMDLLQQCLGLTRAEARVATQLAGGSSPEQAASALGVSLNTIRTHLRAIYRKTGTCGLVDLVRRMAALWAASSVAAATAAAVDGAKQVGSFKQTRRRNSQTATCRLAARSIRQALTQ